MDSNNPFARELTKIVQSGECIDNWPRETYQAIRAVNPDQYPQVSGLLLSEVCDNTLGPQSRPRPQPDYNSPPSKLQSAGLELVTIPSGSFMMGDANSSLSDEKPVHRVDISSFQLSKHEVTNAQYCAFLNEKGNQVEGGVTWLELESEYCPIEKSGNRFVPKSGKANHPVVMVSWYGARAFCKWAGGRLPSESEWEYAARGGDNYKYAGSDNLDEVGWYDGNSGGSTHAVGQKRANGYGLYDMSGNVWEWCADNWHGVAADLMAGR